MRLTVRERLALLSVLPREGDILTLRIVQDLRRALSFSEAEHAALKLTSSEDGVSWDRTGEGDPKDVEIGPKAHTVVSDALQRMSNQKKLTEAHVGIYERFVEGVEPEVIAEPIAVNGGVPR